MALAGTSRRRLLDLALSRAEALLGPIRLDDVNGLRDRMAQADDGEVPVLLRGLVSELARRPVPAAAALLGHVSPEAVEPGWPSNPLISGPGVFASGRDEMPSGTMDAEIVVRMALEAESADS